MINHRKLYLLLIGATTMVMVGLVSGVGLAADCNVLLDAIRKERVLMKKKAAIEAALTQCPDHAGIVYQDGYIFERLRKYDEALLRYKRAIALDSGYAKAYFGIGDVEMLRKNYGAAAGAYTEGLRYEPTNERAKGSLASVRAKNKGGGEKKVADVPGVATVRPTVVVKKKVEPTNTAAVVAPQLAMVPITRLNVPFAKKTVELSQDAKDVLSVVVGQALNRKDMQGQRLEIGGHTDNSGDVNKNREISKQRARVVQKYLADNFGLDSDRLRSAYHGSKKPKVPNNSPANQAMNRRVDFTMID